MGRLSRLTADRVGPEIRRLFDSFLEERGNVPNMFRTVAHRPAILTTLLAAFREVMSPAGTVPIALKEMLAVRVSRLNACDY